MKFHFVKKYCLLLLVLSGCMSCKKYLDAKSDASLSTPSTLADLQAILNNNTLINYGSQLLNESTDEYYIDFDTWDFQAEGTKQGYIWEFAPETEEESDWKVLYASIFYANTVLDNLKKINANGQQDKWNNIKGAALFIRAYHFFQLSQMYANQYDKNTAAGDPGIPLRLSSDFNKPTTRATIEETYNQVIQDVEEAAALLPATSVSQNMPGQAAAFAFLSRVYLQMGEYSKAEENASLCLGLYNSLLDYQTIANTTYPFSQLNTEVIFHVQNENTINVYDFWSITDSMNYSTYASGDLRKELYFEDGPAGNQKVYTGSYNGAYVVFSGLAVDEVYLIRAECNARLGDTSEAMTDLNTLLEKRWDNTFVPYTAGDANEALLKVLRERRKELLNRGTRWSDLRRLNKELQFATTLERVLSGQVYSLPPNDPRYTFLIPKNVVQMTGIQQNNR